MVAIRLFLLASITVVALLLMAAEQSDEEQKLRSQIQQLKKEILVTESKLEELKPQIRTELERIRFKALNKFPTQDTVFLSVGTASLTELYRSCFIAAESEGGVQVSKTRHTYRWRLQDVAVMAPVDEAYFKGNYSIKFHTSESCMGEFEAPIHLTSTHLEPDGVQMKCSAAVGNLGIAINNELLQMSFPARLLDTVQLRWRPSVHHEPIDFNVFGTLTPLLGKGILSFGIKDLRFTTKKGG